MATPRTRVRVEMGATNLQSPRSQRCTHRGAAKDISSTSMGLTPRSNDGMLSRERAGPLLTPRTRIARETVRINENELPYHEKKVSVSSFRVALSYSEPLDLARASAEALSSRRGQNVSSQLHQSRSRDSSETGGASHENFIKSEAKPFNTKYDARKRTVLHDSERVKWHEGRPAEELSRLHLGRDASCGPTGAAAVGEKHPKLSVIHSGTLLHPDSIQRQKRTKKRVDTAIVPPSHSSQGARAAILFSPRKQIGMHQDSSCKSPRVKRDPSAEVSIAVSAERENSRPASRDSNDGDANKRENFVKEARRLGMNQNQAQTLLTKALERAQKGQLKLELSKLCPEFHSGFGTAKEPQKLASTTAKVNPKLLSTTDRSLGTEVVFFNDDFPIPDLPYKNKTTQEKAMEQTRRGKRSMGKDVNYTYREAQSSNENLKPVLTRDRTRLDPASFNHLKFAESLHASAQWQTQLMSRAPPGRK